MSSKVRILGKSELEKMHTGSLMARRQALLACEESREASDREVAYKVEPSYIEFKESEEWHTAYDELKSVLSEREHWPSKGTRKERRKTSTTKRKAR